MNRITGRRWTALSAVLVAGVVGFLGHAAEASAQTADYRELDRTLDGQAAKVDALEKIVKDFPSEQDIRGRCRSSFSVAEMLRSPAEGVAASPDFRLKVVQHQACLSVLVGNSSPCSAIRPAADSKSPQPSDISCQELSWNLLRSKMLMIAPTQPAVARQMCQDMLTQLPDLKIPGNPNALCDTYLSYPTNARERVTRIQKLIGAGGDEDTSRLLRSERRYEGLLSPEECASKEFGWSDRQSCAVARAYRAALVKKDYSLCGDSGFCRALLGIKDKSCSFYADGLAADFCGQRDPTGSLFTDWRNNRKKLIANVDLLRNGMSLILSHTNMSDEPGAARKKRLKGLMARCDALRRLLEPSRAGKPKNGKNKNED